MAIDNRHVCNIQGRVYLKYEGALSEALNRGLKALDVDLVQIPSEANGNVAICKATAVFEEDGRERRFTEYGDASPVNVAPMIRNATIRMAATRAKGRALRDGIGHGEALAEEIGESGPAAPPPAEWKPQQEASPVIRDQFCADCGVEVPPAVVTLSKRKYGRTLCPDHQKTAAVAEAA